MANIVGEELLWRGKRIEDLSREEMIEALKLSGVLLLQAHGDILEVLSAWRRPHGD